MANPSYGHMYCKTVFHWRFLTQTPRFAGQAKATAYGRGRLLKAVVRTATQLMCHSDTPSSRGEGKIDRAVRRPEPYLTAWRTICLLKKPHSASLKDGTIAVSNPRRRLQQQVECSLTTRETHLAGPIRHLSAIVLRELLNWMMLSR